MNSQKISDNKYLLEHTKTDISQYSCISETKKKTNECHAYVVRMKQHQTCFAEEPNESSRGNRTRDNTEVTS